MISWTHSFKEISKDLELSRKKKQALDDLFNKGRISQSTYESLNRELTDAITSIEARRKALAERITSKIGELEQQITVLEMFLANSEIEYAAGEIDEELHQRESNAFAMGLETTKQELNAVKEIVDDLIPGEPAHTPPSTPTEVAEETQKEELIEETPEITVEAPPEPEVSEEVLGEQLMEPPVEKPFAEEPVEVPEEAPPEEPPEEESAEEEEFQPSEEEATEETAEETVETYEVAEEIDVEEPSTEEEATAEEEEYWE